MQSDFRSCHYGDKKYLAAGMMMTPATMALGQLVMKGAGAMYATGDSGNKGLGTPGISDQQKSAAYKSLIPRGSGS